jgi:hypothetical protein
MNPQAQNRIRVPHLALAVGAPAATREALAVVLLFALGHVLYRRQHPPPRIRPQKLASGAAPPRPLRKQSLLPRWHFPRGRLMIGSADHLSSQCGSFPMSMQDQMRDKNRIALIRIRNYGVVVRKCSGHHKLIGTKSGQFQLAPRTKAMIGGLPRRRDSAEGLRPDMRNTRKKVLAHYLFVMLSLESQISG